MTHEACVHQDVIDRLERDLAQARAAYQSLMASYTERGNKYNLLRQKLIKLAAEWREEHYRWDPSIFAGQLEAILDQEVEDSVKPAETLDAIRERWARLHGSESAATMSEWNVEEFELIVAIARAVVKEG